MSVGFEFCDECERLAYGREGSSAAAFAAHRETDHVGATDYTWLVEGVRVIFHDRNFSDHLSPYDGQLATVTVGYRPDQGLNVVLDGQSATLWVHPSECEPAWDWRSSRLIVTGSRDHTDVANVRAGLDEVVATLGHSPPVTLISGGCPTGADRIAEDYWTERGWPIERHVAPWESHGKRAGFLRNVHMTRRGAGACAAFPIGKSVGTRMTMKLATLAGIPLYTMEV